MTSINSKLKFCNVFLALLTTVVLVLAALPAHATEDVEIPEDEELRLPTQTVTAQRGGGSSASLSFILPIVTGGNLSDLASLGLQGDAYSFAVVCNRNPNSFACKQLACEVEPNSKQCETRLDTIVVTGERPKSVDYSNIFNIQVEFSPLWFNDSFEKTKEEQRRSKLEKQCRAAYKDIFTDLANFNFGFTFGSAVGGSINPVDGRATDLSALEDVLQKIVDLTKPIMTTGVNGMKPVAHLQGQEAVNGLYFHITDKMLSRGTHISMPEIFDGTGKREFHLDDQYQHTKGGGAENISQRLVVDFHTHPYSFANSYNLPMYAWPSAQDVYSHVLQRIHQKIDRDAILAIGFMVKGKYYLQLIETHNDIGVDKLFSYAETPDKFGNFLKQLFNSITKIAIIGEDGKEIDYMNFFKNNRNQTSFNGIQLTPSSCDKL